ncbi:MAG TPA: DUF167 family protein [Sandaracinaceae bacterium]
MSTLVIEEREGTVRFGVRVSPRASRDAIAGVHDGALKVSLTAPPVEGAANAALIALLAKALDVPKRAVRITSGESSRIKRVEIEGVSAEAVRALAR